MNSLDLLNALTGAAQANLPPDVKLATIDPAYTVGASYPTVAPNLPKVTFDGEPTLSSKRYPVLNGYVPQPSQRVVMIPVGRTYVILGPATNSPPLLSRNTAILAATGAQISIAQPPGVKARINGTCTLTSGSNLALLWSSSYSIKEYERGGTWINQGGANPERATVPSGMDGFVDVAWALTYPPGDGNLRIANLAKNGVNITQGEPITQVNALFNTCISGFRGMIPVVAGDYFQVNYFHNASSSLTAVTDAAASYISVMRHAV